ncbi:mucin-5AC-like [Anopheles stephensi]|uniref:mucin-5AC-like n=1 Tax=Anopheles stephensi TaxID=30069 RepID=UPI0016587B9D|nr:mucin-5AC-like [Anopheles stephensi]XP_035910523.1 mucin-5AC-like [Anopheles stephensi]
MNTTTMLEACSPPPPTQPHSSVELEHAPWWSAPTSADSLFPEVEVEVEEDGDDCAVREMAAGQHGRKGRADVQRSSATTGERSLGEARKTAADVCRNEFDKIRRFSGTETSVTVHDVCNKTISSSSSRNGGCSSSQFSSGARSHVASGSCNGSGTVAAASPSDAAVATLGQQQQQHLSISPKKPCDFSSIISDSSNSNRGGGGGVGYHSSSSSSGSGSRPFAAPILPAEAAVVGTGGHKVVTALTSLLPDIEWTNETCIGGGGGSSGHSFTNTIVGDPRHLWLSSPTASNSSSSPSISEIELERSLDEYRRASRAGQAKTIETSIDCANLLNELQVELTEPPFTNSPPVSLHEEIEQLSSAFDCDVSNHLVSAADPLPFVGLSANDNEPIPLNILKWLQEDISNNNPVRPELVETPASFFEPPSSSSNEISTTNSAAAHTNDTFERSLDLIHNINGLTQGKRATATTTATTTTTASTHTSANHPQRDHNYYAMKRRLQEEEDVSGEYTTMGGKAKMPKLQHLSDAGWTTTTGNQAKFSTPSAFGHAAPAAAASSSSKQSATAAVNAMGRKLSLASRKAPTLAVNVTPKPSPASTIAGHAVLLQTTASTGTTTTTLTTNNAPSHEPPLRMLPLQQAATLNTPDLTNDILDLEDEKFDLLSFIDTNDESLEFGCYQSTVVVDEKPTLDLLASPSITSTDRLKAPPVDQDDPRSSTPRPSKATADGGQDSKGDAAKQIYQLLTLDSLRQLTNASEDSASSTRAATTTGRRTNASSSVCSIGSRSSASSVCGDSSSDVSSSTTKTPKRRGRPPKAAGTVRDRSQYQHLSEADWRYREQRDKNNEASRKSRINRKDRELKLEMEADRLSAQHQKLSYEERRLQQDCQRWRKAVMKLALL